MFQTIHPFWSACFRGKLSVYDVRHWAMDVYPVIRDFTKFYVNVAAKCDSERTMTFLAETIFEESGSGVESESHPTLFRQFLLALGARESEIPLTSRTDAGKAFWDFSSDIAYHGTFLEGLALVGIGIERPLPNFFQMIARSFQRHFGLSDSDVKFFAVHTIADVKHSQIASRIVSELADTPAAQARVREVVFHLWDLQKQQLDELHRLSHVRSI